MATFAFAAAMVGGAIGAGGCASDAPTIEPIAKRAQRDDKLVSQDFTCFAMNLAGAPPLDAPPSSPDHPWAAPTAADVCRTRVRWIRTPIDDKAPLDVFLDRINRARRDGSAIKVIGTITLGSAGDFMKSIGHARPSAADPRGAAPTGARCRTCTPSSPADQPWYVDAAWIDLGDDYAAYVSTVIAKYGPYLDVVEVMNEPDREGIGDRGFNPRETAMFTWKASHAIKVTMADAHRKDLPVILAAPVAGKEVDGWTYDPARNGGNESAVVVYLRDEIEALHELGVAERGNWDAHPPDPNDPVAVAAKANADHDFFDGVAVHPYYAPGEDGMEPLVRKVTETHAALVAMGQKYPQITTQAVYATEWGRATAWPPTDRRDADERAIAAFLVDGYHLMEPMAKAGWLKAACWFTWDDHTYEEASAQSFGVVRRNDDPANDPWPAPYSYAAGVRPLRVRGCGMRALADSACRAEAEPDAPECGDAVGSQLDVCSTLSDLGFASETACNGAANDPNAGTGTDPNGNPTASGSVDPGVASGDDSTIAAPVDPGGSASPQSLKQSSPRTARPLAK